MTDKIDRYWALSPQKFQYLESVELHRKVDQASTDRYQLTLTLLAEPQSESARGRFTFYGVQELRFGPLDGLLRLAIEITDVRERQLEDISFRVVDSEHQAVEFWCRDFELHALPGPID